MMMMQYPHKLTKQEVHDTLETGKLLLVGLNIVPPDVLEARRLFDVVRADCGDRDPRGFYLSEAMSAVPPCSFSSVMRRIRLLEFSSATRALFTRLGELLGITDTATVSELYVTKIENYMHKVEYDEVEQEALKSLMNETLTKLVPFCTAAADFYEAEEVCDLISMWAWLHSGLAKIRGHLEHTHHLITTTVALCGLLIPRAPLRSPQSHSISVVFTGADDEMKKESAKGNRLVWTIALHYGFADFAYARYLVGYREQEAVPDSFRFLSDDQDEAQIVSALCKDDGNALFSRTKVENAIYRACEERPQFQSKLIKRLADEPHIPVSDPPPHTHPLPQKHTPTTTTTDQHFVYARLCPFCIACSSESSGTLVMTCFMARSLTRTFS